MENENGGEAVVNNGQEAQEVVQPENQQDHVDKAVSMINSVVDKLRRCKDKILALLGIRTKALVNGLGDVPGVIRKDGDVLNRAGKLMEFLKRHGEKYEPIDAVILAVVILVIVILVLIITRG